MLEESLETLGNKLVHWARECYKAEKEYCKAKEQFILYDDVRKIRFAQICDTQPHGHTEAAKNRNSLICPEWLDFTEEFKNAKIGLLRSQIERDNASRFWETTRSILSLRKGELNKLNG